jgi:hypothetical protein
MLRRVLGMGVLGLGQGLVRLVEIQELTISQFGTRLSAWPVLLLALGLGQALVPAQVHFV